jgi:hypothetical protein
MGDYNVQQITEIYKHDKWNMMKVERIGAKFTVREISTEWGEECHVFLSRHELYHFAEQRFASTVFHGDEAERLRILDLFKELCG